MSQLPARMDTIRAVFTALFDAVDSAGEIDEDRWVDLIAVFNATGRLVFGFPHLESSEADVFGALDDIAVELAVTKEAIEKTTADARVILTELRDELGMGEPPPPDEPPLVDERSTSSEPAIEPPIVKPTDVRVARLMHSDQFAAVPSPIDEAPSRVGRGAEEAVAEPPRHLEQVGSEWIFSNRDPQRPNVQDERLFALIREDPTISMAAAERAVGMAASRGIQRMKLLDGYGTLPADIKEWREARGKVRGVPKGVSSQRVREEINVRKPAPGTIKDALASFDERRQESAREASERTWRERHPASGPSA